jgi:mRNA-degrading endonuclease RelE of RelBE toxin-antitoxin system
VSKEQPSEGDQLAAAADEVEAGRGPVAIMRPGHKLVVLVSAEEWQRLEELESAESTAWWRRDADERAGPLLDNPRRVGHPLRDEYAGQHSAHRSADWRIRYRIAEDTHTVIVLDISHRSDTYGT